MNLAFIAGIIILGLVIIMVEVFLVPGTTIIGVIGGIIVVVGVYLSYSEHGVKVGNVTLAISGAATGILLYLGFKAYTSRKFSLNDTLEGKVNVLDESLAVVGDKGVTASYLRPNGKAIINDRKIEVYSRGEYIESGVEVEVVKIQGNKIFVKSKEENK